MSLTMLETLSPPRTEIRPQPGPQEVFLSTPADIAVFGGAAGGGKTMALLMEPLRHIGNPRFGAVIFRRTVPQIIAEGGLWDTAAELYAPLGAEPIQQPYRWTFPSGAKIECQQLQHEKDAYNWQGAQIPLIEYDELAQFTPKQFWYLLSRNRSLCGVRPYIRAATNPDPDSFVKELIRWWLDNEGEYADESKAGILRWMLRSGDDVLWFDSQGEARDYAADVLRHPELQPLSVTFVPSSIYDNRILLESNPTYLANLQALTRVEKERLLKGNWKVRATAGMIFSRSDFEILDALPAPEKVCRCWDRAATEPHPENQDPDWTAGVKMARTNGSFFITDVARFRRKSGEVETRIKNTASQDGPGCTVVLYKDPGQAGKAEIGYYYRLLAGYSIRSLSETTRKYLKWQPLAAQAQAGNVKLLRAPWNDAFLSELENLTENESEYGHDDQADAAAGAFEELAGRKSWRPV